MLTRIIGRIISNSLGSVGEDEIPYGYIDVTTDDGKQFHIKVDVHTFHETLNPGYDVEIEMDILGSTDILIAKTISIVDQVISSKKLAKATA